jgi:hypothetical protein
MPLSKAIKDRIVEVIESHEQDEIDLGTVHVEDIIDDLNFIIECCNVQAPVYEECVRQVNKMYDDCVIDTEDRDYIISQLYSK